MGSPNAGKIRYFIQGEGSKKFKKVAFINFAEETFQKPFDMFFMKRVVPTLDFMEEKTRQNIEEKFKRGETLLSSLGNGQVLGPSGIQLEFRNGNRKLSVEHSLEFQFFQGEEIIQCLLLNEDILRL